MGDVSDSYSDIGSGGEKDSLRSVVGINRRSVFTLDEARALFPVVQRLTKSYSERVDALIAQIDRPDDSKHKSQSTEDRLALEAEARRLFDEWQVKMRKLGGLPNGVWVVDFDSGDGYFCWKYPEPELGFWHAHHDGFSKRTQISERIDLVKELEISFNYEEMIEPTLNGVAEPK